MLSNSTPFDRRYTCDQAPQGPDQGTRLWFATFAVSLMVYCKRMEEASTKSSPPRRILTVRVPVGVKVDAEVG